MFLIGSGYNDDDSDEIVEESEEETHAIFEALPAEFVPYPRA